jgi:hypothetical protein
VIDNITLADLVRKAQARAKAISVN